MWKGFPHWQQGWRIAVCFFPALWRISLLPVFLLKNRVFQCCLHCRQWMCLNCWLQLMLEAVVQKLRPVCVLPLPQLTARHLQASWQPRLSPSSRLRHAEALEWVRNGREEGSCASPERGGSRCRLQHTYWARLGALCLGMFTSPLAAAWTACLRVDKRHRERDCTANRKVTENVTFLSFSEAKTNPFLPCSPSSLGSALKTPGCQFSPSVHIYHEGAVALSCFQLLARDPSHSPHPELKTLALWIKGALYTLWELSEVDFASHNNPGTSRLLGMLFFLFLSLFPGCFIALRVCIY